MFAGLAGLNERLDGAEGAVESSVYETAEEHAETLPAVSVAFAVNEVVVSSLTETAMPGDANAAVVPVATIEPEQLLVAYTLIEDDASAVPRILGELLLAGPAGLVEIFDGAAGAVVSRV